MKKEFLQQKQPKKNLQRKKKLLHRVNPQLPIKNNKKTDEIFAMIEALKKIKAFLLELKANL